MSDINENPQTENEEDVVYEYVELEEGQELPEGYEYEYEYVEVPEGGTAVSELDVVQQKIGVEEPSEEIEMASAEEIEAALRPMNIDAMIEGTSVSEIVSVTEETVAEPSVGEVSVEEKMPQIAAPGSDENISELLDYIHEPQFEVPKLEDIAETDDLPKFEIEPPAPTGKESGIPSLSSIFDGLDDEPIDEAEHVVNEGETESAFIELPNIKFQNSEDDFNKTNWFDAEESNSDTALNSVDAEKTSLSSSVSAPTEEVVAVQEIIEESEASHEVSETIASGAEPVSVLSEISDVLSEMKVEHQDNGLAFVADEDVASETDLGEDNFVTDTKNILSVSNTDETEELSLDDLLREDVNAAEEEIPVSKTVSEEDATEEAILPTSVEDGGIPAVDNIFFDIPKTEDEAVQSAETEEVVESVEAEVQTENVSENEPIVEVASETTVQDPVVENDTFSELLPQSEDVVVPNVIPLASELVIDTAKMVETVINPSVNSPVVTDCSAEQFGLKAQKARLVSKNDGVQSFKGTEATNVVALNDVDFEQNELSSWNLILFNQEIVPLTAKVSELDMPRNSQVNRFTSLVKAGETKAEFFNEDKLKILNTSESCVAVQGRFICGDLQANSGLIINDMITIPLQEFAGKELSFKEAVSGMLCGPNGALLYFFNLRGVLVPSGETAKIDADKLQYKISKWYSGNLNDKYFEFNAQSPSASFEGNDEIKAIHVNVNNSSYGWNVAFDNGLSMNLRDLREYQTRFGKMPSPNGVISYGQTKLTFSNVERIVVYESVQYFFYS